MPPGGRDPLLDAAVAEPPLPEPAELFRSVDLMAGAAFVADSALVIRAVNDDAAALFGRPASDLVGRHVFDLVAARSRRAYDSYADTGIAVGTSHQFGEEVAAIVTPDGDEVALDAVTRPVGTTDGVYRVVSMRDATTRRRLLDVLQSRDQILRAVAFSAHALVTAEEWEEAVAASLRALGEAARVSRSYVFEVVNAGFDWLWTQRWEWVADGIEPQIDNPVMQRMPMRGSGFDRWERLLLEDGAVVGNVAEFPDAERDFLAAQDIRAIAVVPIMVRDEWWGLLGFDECLTERRWSPGEIEALHAAAEVFAAALQRRSATRALVQSRQAYADAYERERQAAERLRVLDTMKDGFLEAVSHELRTPLTSILGLAETMGRLDADLDREAQRDLASRIASNTARLRQLLGDLTDLDELVRRGGQVDRGPVDLLALASSAVSDLREWMGDRSVATELEVREAMVDVDKVDRILRSLLRNVAAHTPENTSCWVRTSALGQDLLLVVEDDGPGIPLEQRRSAFLPFQQGDLRNPHAPGTGIGLAVVARLAAVHGGEAWAEERPGGGARIVVRLPSASVAADVLPG